MQKLRVLVLAPDCNPESVNSHSSPTLMPRPLRVTMRSLWWFGPQTKCQSVKRAGL